MNTSFALPRPSSLRSARRGAGFTLIELLVVIAIIGILAALLTAAILNVFGAANRDRNKNNATRLQAAIVEYWHDMGKWPLPTNAKRDIRKTNVKTVKYEGDDSTEHDIYTYTVSYKENNNEVVKLLLGVDFNGTTKDFLDLHGFATTVDAKPASWPAEATVDAWIAYQGEAVDEETGRKIAKRTDPVLVYREDFYKCPHCGEYFSRPLCSNTGCSFYRENGAGYRMSSTDRISAAKPYVITFDLKNNTVSVSAP